MKSSFKPYYYDSSRLPALDEDPLQDGDERDLKVQNGNEATAFSPARASKRRSRRDQGSVKSVDRISLELSRSNTKLDAARRDVKVSKQNGYIIKLQHEVSVLKQNCDKSEKEKLQLQELTAELDEKAGDQEQSIAKMQNQVLQTLGSAHWQPPPDEDTRSILNNLEKQIKDWARKYAKERLSGSPGAGLDSNSLRREWRDFALFDCDTSYHSQSALGVVEEQRGWLLMTSWVTNYIYRKIVVQPFFFFDGWIKGVQEGDHDDDSQVDRIFGTGQDLEQGLGEILQLMASSKNPYFCLRPSTNRSTGHGRTSSSVNRWRADTLRLLGTPPDAKSSSESEDMRARNLCSKRIAGIFCRKPVVHENLNPYALTEAIQELGSLFMEAGALSYRLWCQNSILRVESQDFLGTPFDSRHRFLSASRLHAVALEDDETCLDGNRIILVTHPAVWLEGDSEGIDYTKTRILKKASVLIATER
jgi:hypothetical protein